MNSSLHDKSQRLIVALVLGVSFALQPLPVVLAEPDSSKSDVELSEQEKSLVDHWKKHQSSLTTLHIKYNSFHQGGDVLREVTPEEVLEIFDPDDLVEDPELLRDVQKRLLTMPIKVDPPWSVAEFYSDHNKARDERPYSIGVFDGEVQIYRDASNRHIKIGESRKHLSMHINAKRDFCTIPYQRGAFGIVKYVESEGSSDKFVLRTEGSIQGDVSWFEVGKTTRMIERSMLVMEYGEEKYVTLIVQGGWTEYQPGFYWPRAYGEFRFQGKSLKLNTASIRISTSVEFNEPVDPLKFVVAAQPGDTVFDYRKDDYDGDCYRVPNGADDVKKTSR